MKRILLIFAIMFTMTTFFASCGLIERQEHVHQFGEWTITENATCEKAGMTVRYCSCGTKQSETIPSISHSVVVDQGVAPTCTATGLTEGAHCSECNKIIAEQTKINALEHTEVINKAIEPTCISTGLTEGKYCSVCEEVIVAQIEVPKIDHTYEGDNDKDCNVCGFIRNIDCTHDNVIPLFAKDATCIEPGLTEGKVCADCEIIVVAQTVIDSKGHTEVVDEALAPTYETTGLTEGKHCSECNMILVKQQIVPVLSKRYKITFVDVPKNDYNAKYENEFIYSIDEQVALKNPVCPGLLFTHWSDQEGNIYTPYIDTTFLPEDISGNLIFTANWKNKENLFTPADDSTLYEYYSGEDGFLYFFYDLGAIEHVVLDNGILPEHKDSMQSITLKLSETTSISEEKANEIAETVSTSIMQTTTWENTKSWATTLSHEFRGDAKVEVNIPWFEVMELGVEASFGWSSFGSETDSCTKSNGGSHGVEDTNSKTVTTSLSYKEEFTSSFEKEYYLSGDMPEGYYSYAHVGNVRVIAVVCYDTSTGEVYLNTYSRIVNVHTKMMYYRDDDQLNNSNVDGLNFTISEDRQEEIENIIKKYYYVSYDANGGIGDMLTSRYTVNAGEQLPENTFIREGYTFDGWEFVTSEGIKVLKDSQSIIDLASPGKNVTLKAIWKPNVYTLAFVNDYGEAISEQKVKFGDVIELIVPNRSYSSYYTFAGWESNGENYGCTYTVTIASDITFTAKWNQVYPEYTYIYTAEDFKWHIGNNLEKGSKPDNCGAGKYMLLNDIDLGDWNEGWGYTYWASNNESTTLNAKTCFTGVFDGQNHTITYKLRVGKTNLQSWAFGLFPVTDGATIKDLKVKADLSTYDPQNRGQKWHISNDDRAEDAMVGGLVGYAKNTTIENCSVSGQVIYNSDGGGGDTCVAGVVGYAYNSTVKNCSSSAEVYARGYYVNVAGVMACYYNTSYSGLSATGKIHFNEDWIAGGHWSGNEVTKSLKVL